MRGLSQDSSTFQGSNMGSKVFMTYKRKRLFSRGDHSHIDFFSDANSEISASASSANLDKHEKQDSEHTLPTKEKIVEEHSPKLQKLDPCTKPQDSLILECSTIDQARIPQDSDGKQITFNPNIIIEGDCEEPCRIDSAAQSNGERKTSDGQFNSEGKSSGAKLKLWIVESSSDHKCAEKVLISLPPDGFSAMESDIVCTRMPDGNDISRKMDTCISGPFTEEKLNKLPKDNHGGFCNDMLADWKSSKGLLTYQRRSKRKKDIAAQQIASEAPGITCPPDKQLAGSPLIAPSDEKSQKPPVDIDNLSASAVPAPKIAIAVQMKDPLLLPEGTNKCPQDPRAGAVSCDIDCNKPLPNSVFNEKHPLGPSEVLPDTLGSSSKSNGNIQTALEQCKNGNPPAMAAVVNKGKSVIDYSPPESAGGSSSKSMYLQLFPEKSSSSGVPQLAIDREQSRIHPQTFYYPPYPWAGVAVHPRETFHNFLLPPTPDQAEAFSRHKLMLDNMMNRARAARGNRSIFPDMLPAPTRWSEEELDCLWIGVRRHGRGNWDAMLRDRRLQFSPWKTSRDLAEKWQEEQSRLFPSTPVPQVTYHNPFPPEHLNNHLLHPPATGQPDIAQLSLANAYARHDYSAPPSRHLFQPVNIPTVQYNYQLTEPVRNSAPGPMLVIPNESSIGKGPPLPHWLREAAAAPPTLWANQTTPQNGGKPNRTNSKRVVKQARNEACEVKASKPDDGLIVIPSDASSEETISDDRTNRSTRP